MGLLPCLLRGKVRSSVCVRVIAGSFVCSSWIGRGRWLMNDVCRLTTVAQGRSFSEFWFGTFFLAHPFGQFNMAKNFCWTFRFQRVKFARLSFVLLLAGWFLNLLRRMVRRAPSWIMISRSFVWPYRAGRRSWLIDEVCRSRLTLFAQGDLLSWEFWRTSIIAQVFMSQVNSIWWDFVFSQSVVVARMRYIVLLAGWFLNLLRRIVRRAPSWSMISGSFVWPYRAGRRSWPIDEVCRSRLTLFAQGDLLSWAFWRISVLAHPFFMLAHA